MPRALDSAAMDRESRKDLIQAHKEATKPMGVYRVYSSESGHGVVGASRDLPSILNRHQAQLSMGGHPDKALQEEWDTCAPDVFVFEVLDTLAPREELDYDPTDDLQELTEMWRERLKPGG